MGGCWGISRLCVRTRVSGLEHVSNEPGIILVFNHKSDLDGVVMVPAVYWHIRGKGPLGRMAFVGGEHIYQPGFLAGYVMPRPRWLRPLLFRLSAAGFMRGIRCYPIPMAKRRFLAAHLTDLLVSAGDMPLSAVLRDSPEQIFPGVAPDATVSSVLHSRYAEELYALHELDTFRPEIAAKLIERQRSTVRDAIDLFAAVLDEGDALVVAPEGGLSPDGRISRIKSGLRQIAAAAMREVTLLPMSVTYDFMATGRPTAYVRVGPPVYDAKQWPPEEWEQRLRRILAMQTTVTFSQLAAEYTLEQSHEDGCALNAGAMKAELVRRAVAYAAQGLHVAQDLLQPAAFDRRWIRFIAYCRQRALGQLANGVLKVDAPRTTSARHAAHVTVSPWVYAANELAELLEAR